MPEPIFTSLSDATPSPRRRLRVLVADDDHDAVATLEALLLNEGHQVMGVDQGKEVLRLTRDFKPDAVLLDISMPGLSGYDVARELREVYGDHAPLLIAVTAWTMPSDRILALMVGFDHHVSKPYDPQALLALLNDETK